MNFELISDKRDKLLIFFGGWSMDHCFVRNWETDTHDILSVCDYTEPAPPIALDQWRRRYQSVDLVAWSLGVWMAAFMLQDEDCSLLNDVAAVNGTLHPIDDLLGIPGDVFTGTVKNWPVEAMRQRFYRRICSKNALSAFPWPERTPESQQMELMALETRITANMQLLPVCFKRAAVSQNDRIFAAENQLRAWHNAGIAATVIDDYHDCLSLCRKASEVLSIGKSK